MSSVENMSLTFDFNGVSGLRKINWQNYFSKKLSVDTSNKSKYVPSFTYSLIVFVTYQGGLMSKYNLEITI